MTATRAQNRTHRGHASLPYQPGLDGVRALAIIAVLLYHGGVSWAGGGFLGVEAFFVLSGFLITSLLLVEWRSSGAIRLRAFWARRARRLLPALFAVVIVIGIYYASAGPLSAIPGLRGDGIATLFYFGNWHQIATGSSYFFTNGAVSPFQHTWSLAIEEQFYVVWPLLLSALFWIAGRSRRAGGQARQGRSLRLLLAVTVLGLVASAADMLILFHGGSGLNRVYYGTDTRATGLLAGASLAVLLALRAGPPAGSRPARAIAGGAVLTLAAVLCAMHFADGSSNWLFPWGLVGVDLCVALVIAAITLVPSSPVARVFAIWPMRAIGQISYGLYLWHFPLFQWIGPGVSGTHGIALLFVRLAIALAVATVSYFVIEQPIRRRRLPTFIVRPLLPAAAAAGVAALLAAAAVGAQIPGSTVAPTPRTVALRFAGNDGPCRVPLRDTADYRTVPLPASETGGYIFHWILSHSVVWNAPGFPNSGALTFHTCPPRRVMMIGDSIAFTLGVPMLQNETSYGVELANASTLGCDFGNRGRYVDNKGALASLPPECAGVLTRWQQDAARFKAQVIVIELGYRDEFNWSWDGRIVHLGDRRYDAAVQHRIDRFVTLLGEGGKRKVLLLTVPYAHPGDLLNGSPQPQADPSRHRLINSMLRAAARAHPTYVSVLDLDKLISPGNHYDQNVNGQPCRFDGIHFTIYCATLLQPDVLGRAAALATSGS